MFTSVNVNNGPFHQVLKVTEPKVEIFQVYASNS